MVMVVAVVVVVVLVVAMVVEVTAVEVNFSATADGGTVVKSWVYK
jgi:hypothetical protein